MTLPTSYGWYPIGQTQHIPHEAPQGRRVNAIGASCSHGPQAGGFMFATYASVPKSTAKKARKTIEERAATHQVDAACLGPIDGERLVAFFWQLSGRPLVHTADWRRERRLIIVLDNYSVHKGDAVKGALSDLEAANIELFYLPSYSPADVGNRANLAICERPRDALSDPDSIRASQASRGQCLSREGKTATARQERNYELWASRCLVTALAPRLSCSLRWLHSRRCCHF